MKIAVQILNFNNYNVTIKCIKSLLMTNYSNLEIYVLDNGSHNNSFQFLSKFIISLRSNRVFLLRSKENLGYGNGHNYILKFITSKYNQLNYFTYIMLVNSDVIFKANFFNLIIQKKSIINEEEILYCFPQYNSNINKESYPYYSLNKFFGTTRAFKRIPTNISSFLYQYYPSAAVWLFHNSFFQKIGFFNKNFFLFCEEIDIIIRLSKKGYSFKVIKDIPVYHDQGASSEYSNSINDKENFKYFLLFHGYRSTLILFYSYYSVRIYFFKFRIFLSLMKSIFIKDKVKTRVFSYFIFISKNELFSGKLTLKEFIEKFKLVSEL